MLEFLGSINAWLYWIFSIAYAVTIVSIVGVIISENRNPVKSLAWVTVLLLLPVVGIILYLFFGRSIKTRMISRRNRRRLKRHHQTLSVKSSIQALSPESVGSIRLSRSLTSTAFYPGNHVDIFTDGKTKFDRLEADLRAARRYINIQYYIFADDATGRRISDILKERAREGVTVRVIYDHVGSLSTSRRFFREMEEAGIEVHPFFKVTFPPFGTRINWRNHRKICIIDGTVGYIGGMNVADRYIDGGKKFTMWRDNHARIEGPAVASLQYSFAIDWSFMGQELITDPLPRPVSFDDGVGVQLLSSGPTAQWPNIAFQFIRVIAAAKHRVYLYTPYFLPTEALLKALQTAALAGVDVRVLMPRRSDSMMLNEASRSYVSECLRSGIKFYLYTAGMMHAKTLIVDDEYVSVGSTNFDFRSFEHNFEANIQIYSREVNAHMAEIFRDDLSSCVRILPSQWNRRPIHKKAIQSILRLLSPIL
ncbi:MAG: cardiolipin synthase [Bacteroides sp.]|nr:cardiolipin synthase [Bacteroides sp.]MCM1456309.1 cardiolipin synthase [Lachnoclostridium sp.]